MKEETEARSIVSKYFLFHNLNKKGYLCIYIFLNHIRVLVIKV